MNKSRVEDTRYNQEKFKQLVSQCIIYCLSQNEGKKKIRKDLIVEACLEGNRQQFKEIIQGVETLLKSNFGLQLLPAHSDGYFITRDKSKMSDLQIENEYEEELNDMTEEEKLEKQILELVISAIYLRDDMITEDDLYEFLSKSGLMGDDFLSDILAKYQETKRTKFTAKDYYDHLLKKKFVKQLYLDYKKNEQRSSKLEVQFMFTLGPRGEACRSKENIQATLDHILKLSQ
uniref:MAGE domain-containing protein n=1 Tax=Clastoptera arizonana TaxID=38151 RepID=A0A1B6CAE4_9HEMI